jgi:ketosteroid isomerase-like protein
MKRTNALLCVLACASIFILSQCSPTPSDVTSEIAKINDGFMAAYNSGDLKTLVSNYTDQAKLYPSNSDVVEGTQAIEGFWGAVMNMGIKKAQMETVSAQQVGNIAIEEGRYKLFVEGDIMVDQGKYLVTWEKENGQWKIARDIWNTNNPATVVRAGKDNSVWVILNHVKQDKLQQFEDFNLNYLKPAGDEFFPEMTKTVRFLKSEKPNADGTITYFYLMDPAMKDNNYDILPVLTAKFGKEKADEYYKMFLECIKKNESFETVQTGW